MGWFVRESRGGLSWRDQTLGSISPPPLPLMVFLGSVFFWMYLGSNHSDYKAESSNSTFILRFLVPLLAIFFVHIMMVSNRWFSPAPTGYYSRPFYQSMSDDSSSPLRLALLLLLLLVMAHYQGSVQSGWFRLL